MNFFKCKLFHSLFSTGNKSELINSETNKTIFIFGGRVPTYERIGKQLYTYYPEFKSKLNECDEVIKKISGTSILPIILGEKSKNEISIEFDKCYTQAIQISLIHLLNSEGIEINAVAGICGGELTAAIASGIFDLETAFKILYFWSDCNLSTEEIFAYYKLPYSKEFTESLIVELNLGISIIYNQTDEISYILVPIVNEKQLEHELKKRSLEYKFIKKDFTTYHSIVEKYNHHIYYELFRTLKFNPPNIEYYSSRRGQKVSNDQFLSREYFIDIISGYIPQHELIHSIIEDGFNQIIIIGPNPIDSNWTLNLKPNLHIEYSFTSEDQELKNTQDIINKLRSAHSRTQIQHKNSRFTDVLNNFNIYNTNSIDELNYFRNFGDTHFLIKNNAFTVLDYATCEFILKNDKLFNSDPYLPIENLLLGSNGETHDTIKNHFIRNLFHSENLKKLENNTLKTSNLRILEISNYHSYDIVNQFSNPVLEETLFQFFGLNFENSTKFKSTILDYRDSDWNIFFNQLHVFFSETLNQSSSGLLADLNELTLNKVISTDEAISLARLFWVASFETTSAFISIIFRQFLNCKWLWPSLHENEQNQSKFIEECLRLETTSRVIRKSATDIKLGNCNIKKDEIIILNLQAANTDPKQFDNPMEFRINRPLKKSLAFGTGIHQCIGMGMSRSIGKSVLKSLIANKEILKDRLPLKTEFSFANFNDHFKNIRVVQGQPSKKYIYSNQLEIQSKL